MLSFLVAMLYIWRDRVIKSKIDVWIHGTIYYGSDSSSWVEGLKSWLCVFGVSDVKFSLQSLNWHISYGCLSYIYFILAFLIHISMILNELLVYTYELFK